jgi:hypothetical protein
MKKKLFLIMTVIGINSIFILSTFAAETAPKKKIYISALKPSQNLTRQEADRARDFITLSIFEKFGASYTVITDEDIKVMFQQAALLQSSGCVNDNCSIDLAQLIYADEIVYGSLSKEGERLVLNVKNIEIRKKPAASGTKSMVRLAFSRQQSEWYCREAGMKLINPAYRIDTAKVPLFKENIDISDFDLKPVKGANISQIVFKPLDDNTARYIEVMRPKLAEGDALFADKKYKDAREKYVEIKFTILEKLSHESIEKMDGYLAQINRRIDVTYAMDSKMQIDAIDAAFKTVKNPEEKDFTSFRDRYDGVTKTIDLISESSKESSAMLKDLNESVRKRKNALTMAIISIHERKADAEYRDYKFDQAVDSYYQEKLMAVHLVDEPKIEDQIDKKYLLAFETGRSYLRNIVTSYIVQAEYYNLTGNTKEAVGMMQKAKDAMSGPLKKFTTAELIASYNDYVDKVPGSKYIKRETNPEIFKSITSSSDYTPEKQVSAPLDDEDKAMIFTVCFMAGIGITIGIIYANGGYDDDKKNFTSLKEYQKIRLNNKFDMQGKTKSGFIMRNHSLFKFSNKFSFKQKAAFTSAAFITAGAVALLSDCEEDGGSIVSNPEKKFEVLPVMKFAPTPAGTSLEPVMGCKAVYRF